MHESRVARRGLLAAGLLLPPAAARAQVAPSSPLPASGPAVAGASEDVVVTGQRKSAPLQKAPVSVTVIDKATLQAAGVRRAGDLVALAPGVSLVAGTAEAGDSQVNIRGINSARDAGASFAFVIDGILLPNPAPSTASTATSARSRSSRGPRTPSTAATRSRAPSW